MQLLQLVQAQIQVGAPLPWNVRNAASGLLLARGQVIQSERQLENLLDRGLYVDEEEFQAVERARLAAAGPAAPAAAPVRPPSLIERWDLLVPRLEALTIGTREAGFDFVAQLGAAADELLALVERDADVGIYLAVRQERNKLFHYGYTHSVHAALVAVLVAQRLQWPAPRLRSLAQAALTMNIAILELQGRMAAQEIPPLDRQRAEIRKHPEAGVQQLEQLGVTDADWLATVAEHHEQPSGQGYPRGITTPCEMAQVLRLADVFMAKISPRAIRPALPMQEAARHTFREDKGGPLSMALIKEFGIYPPGDFVQLKSGELAVVMRRSANANAPQVCAITDALGKPIARTVRRDTAEPAFAIAGPVPEKDKTSRALLARLPPERLYGYT